MCGAGLTPLLLVDQFANAAFLPMHPVAQSIVTALDVMGIQVSRRTVAKYRDELGIPASSRRRLYL